MEYDYVIVGGGSAGCTLAAWLSENPDVKVLLLEAGASDWNPMFHWPAGFAKMTKGIASWGWSTVFQKHMSDRVFRYTQAKVIGGGSTINPQIYSRGNNSISMSGPNLVVPVGPMKMYSPTSSARRQTRMARVNFMGTPAQWVFQIPSRHFPFVRPFSKQRANSEFPAIRISMRRNRTA
jgi:hypothetical protein